MTACRSFSKACQNVCTAPRGNNIIQPSPNVLCLPFEDNRINTSGTCATVDEGRVVLVRLLEEVVGMELVGEEEVVEEVEEVEKEELVGEVVLVF